MRPSRVVVVYLHNSFINYNITVAACQLFCAYVNIFETIFAVIYAHIMREQMPTALMSIGMVLLLVGVFMSVRVFQHHSKNI